MRSKSPNFEMSIIKIKSNVKNELGAKMKREKLKKKLKPKINHTHNGTKFVCEMKFTDASMLFGRLFLCHIQNSTSF